MTHQNLRLGKCWKLLWATFRDKLVTSVVMEIRHSSPWCFRMNFARGVFSSKTLVSRVKRVIFPAKHTCHFLISWIFQSLITPNLSPDHDCYWLESWTKWHVFAVTCLLQQTITWYKIRHAGGQAHYSRTGTLKQRRIELDWLRSLCLNVPVRA